MLVSILALTVNRPTPGWMLELATGVTGTANKTQDFSESSLGLLQVAVEKSLCSERLASLTTFSRPFFAAVLGLDTPIATAVDGRSRPM